MNPPTVREQVIAPDARGIAEAFSRIGYRTEEALADLIDNSIDARACMHEGGRVVYPIANGVHAAARPLDAPHPAIGIGASNVNLVTKSGGEVTNMAKIDLATRRVKCRHVELDDLIEGFERVGIHAGDTVFCHSSLSKFGYVEGGAETVVDALAAVVGRAGTVAGYAGRPSVGLGPDPIFDVRNTPSERGVISEAIRKRSTGRSHHLIDSVSAFGPAARYLTSTHSVTNCGADSPYQKLIATDAQILLLGVSHNSNTTFEAVEEELAPSYVKFKDIPGARIIDEGGEERLLPTKRQDFEYSSDFNKLNGKLIRAGAQSEIVIGEAIVRRVSAAKLHEVVRRAIEADTFVVRLRDGEQPLPEIPTSIHDLPA